MMNLDHKTVVILSLHRVKNSSPYSVLVWGPGYFSPSFYRRRAAGSGRIRDFAQDHTFSGELEIALISVILHCSLSVSEDFEDGEVCPQGSSGNTAASTLGLWLPLQPAGLPFGMEESHLCLWDYYLPCGRIRT